VGILAALLAVGIAVGAGGLARVIVRHAARRDAQRVAADYAVVKYQSLFLQRAALEDDHLLPVYGSSELYCCGDPYRATQVFSTEPTGFDAFAVGQAGVANLLFMQMFGALGTSLRGKRIVIVGSPPWYNAGESYRKNSYDSNFSREVGEAFIFDSPISPFLRQAAARQMLAYPRSLDGNLLLRLGVESLARPTGLHRLTFGALAPLGRIEAWIDESRGAIRTLLYLRHHAGGRRAPPVAAQELDWVALATDATNIAVRRNTTNPFGIPDATYRLMVEGKRPKDVFDSALATFRSGVTNRDGQLFPFPDDWRRNMTSSEEWTDLRLAAAVLRELGARPFFWTMPLDGFFDDYTPLSASARQNFYDRWEHVVGRTGFEWLDFRDADEDRFFVTGVGGHLGPRGWVFADYALDRWWHGQSVDEIRDGLAALSGLVPQPPLAPVWQVTENKETP
jgi:D-alanine transfer protein